MSILKVDAIVNENGGTTATINGYTPTMSNMAGRNRIINGDMRIDQRNAGASYSQSTSTIYGLDRWSGDIDTGTGRWDVQQVSDAPVGFSNSLKVTITTQESQPTSARHQIYQPIEGYNISDLGFGTANASPITMSFWVKTSVTGIHSVSVASGNYIYTTSYTVNSADTWEYKIITVPGATAGSWGNTNGVGLFLEFTLGGGTSQIVTANTWYSSAATGIVSGSVYLPATSGATWQITGVQLEAGSVATPFEHVDYSEMLRRCQRYYVRFNSLITGGLVTESGYSESTSRVWGMGKFPVEMRTNPTALEQSGTAGHYNGWEPGVRGNTFTSVPTFYKATQYHFSIYGNVSSCNAYRYHVIIADGTNNAYLGFSAEL